MQPLYLKIREDLLAGFEMTGERKLPAESELCRRYGVCRPTVHKALEYLLEHEMIVRLPGKGSFFREDFAHKANRVRNILGVIRHDWISWENNLHFCAVLQGILRSVMPRFRLTLEQYSEPLLYKMLDSDEAATVWISPEETEIAAMKKLADADRLVVSVNRIVDYPGIRSVATDHPGIGVQAARAWREAGFSRLCSVHLELEHIIHDEIAAGFDRANRMEELGLTRRSEAVPQRNWQRDGKAIFQSLLQEGERAFFLCSSALTPMAVAAFRAEKLTLGKDVFLLVLGDDFKFEAEGFSVVRIPSAELGRIAGEIVCGVKHDSGKLLPEEIVYRASFPQRAGLEKGPPEPSADSRRSV